MITTLSTSGDRFITFCAISRILASACTHLGEFPSKNTQYCNDRPILIRTRWLTVLWFHTLFMFILIYCTWSTKIKEAIKSLHLRPTEATIQFLASGSLQHTVASAAGTSTSFLCCTVWSSEIIIKWLQSHILFPNGTDARYEIKHGFILGMQFRGVLGSVYATHLQSISQVMKRKRKKNNNKHC